MDWAAVTQEVPPSWPSGREKVSGHVRVHSKLSPTARHDSPTPSLSLRRAETGLSFTNCCTESPTFRHWAPSVILQLSIDRRESPLPPGACDFRGTQCSQEGQNHACLPLTGANQRVRHHFCHLSASAMGLQALCLLPETQSASQSLHTAADLGLTGSGGWLNGSAVPGQESTGAAFPSPPLF